MEWNVAKHCGNGTHTGKSRVVQRQDQRGSIVNALKKEKKEKSINNGLKKKKKDLIRFAAAATCNSEPCLAAIREFFRLYD